MAECSLCTAGKYQADDGKSGCQNCPTGSYCEEGSSTPLPCLAGTWSNTYSLESAHGCSNCSAGYFCPTGSTKPLKCTKGQYAEAPGSKLCEMCPQGKYQDESEQSSCKDCNAGDYCPVGSSIALLPDCAPGTYANSTDASGTPECFVCPAGHYCSGGASPVVPCAPGSYASSNRSHTCTKCEGGSYQIAQNATGCLPCEPGYYCGEGSAVPIPCPGGTSSDATDLEQSSQCTPVPAGYWAPLGSSEPKACPASGFYCPGAAADEVNDPPGSEPIIVPVGGSTEEVEVVQKTATLDMDISEYNETTVILQLAAQYGIDPALISLEASGGSIVITITIASSAVSSSGAAVSSNITALLDAVAAVDDTALGTAIGVTVSSTAATQTTQVVSSVCPAGHWCTAGLVVPCEAGFYNPSTGADSATDCLQCPEHATTAHAGSTSLAACACREGFTSSISSSGAVQVRDHG
jgi:hypothetical protein